MQKADPKGKLATDCRRGFQSFFKNAGLSGRMPAVVACGSRNDAYDDFCTAVKRLRANTLPLLLVDSEEDFSTTPWEHLKDCDDWDRPENATNDHAYLMVQCMEAWFLADHDCLKKYFGQGFAVNSLPGNADVETIPKSTIYQSLKMATRRSESKGEYGKGKHSLWRQYDWDTEVFFRIFKTGCQVEKIQLETLSRLKNCLAFYKIISWRILYPTYLNRECPTLPCDAVFDDCEWKSVWRVVTRTELPPTPPSLSEFMPLLTQLGGYNNRKTERPPGPQPIWVGIRRMTDLATAWMVFGPGT